MYEGKSPYNYLSKGRFINELKLLRAFQERRPPALKRPEAPVARTTMPEDLWHILLKCWRISPVKRSKISDIYADLRNPMLSSAATEANGKPPEDSEYSFFSGIHSGLISLCL
jgi:hypothetical protein